MSENNKFLRKVILTSDVYAACLQHALTTEKEEVMGLLIGNVNDKTCISHISACVILHRSDKRPDRVEISPEQLSTASDYAEELANKLNRPMRVLGWYHSHPHITVWPSHVDVRTQAMYQMMDPLFIGLIFSVYQSDPATKSNKIQLTCFQAQNCGNEQKSKGVPLQIVKAPFSDHTIQTILSLPKILSQEEVQTHEDEGDKNTTDILTMLHNDSLETAALVDIVSKVALPLCEDLENRLKSARARIEELERLKKELNEELAMMSD